ncbi:hypothetical protein [Methylomonas koyamae]|uniref:hypothetical protein n=1 Tax=Methylomonas koyamae TaxID=702114 RepID=UPI00210F9B50|nr:hypothetical protein [Methylomonas koyamae]
MRGRVELAEREVERTRRLPQFHALAQHYLQLFQDNLHDYQQRYQCDLLAAFQRHHSGGRLELITTAATHGYLPLLNVNPASVRNQIGVGVDSFRAQFGFAPHGFWLPECGYYPGLEQTLKAEGIDYFFLESHALLNADRRPQFGVYAPVDCGGIAAFGRDPAASHQVWSAESGYPATAITANITGISVSICRWNTSRPTSSTARPGSTPASNITGLPAASSPNRCISRNWPS